MKYKINDKVFLGDSKCKIVGTREEPYKTKSDTLGRKEIFPDEGDDYIVNFFIETENRYSGTLSVKEYLLEDENW